MGESRGGAAPDNGPLVLRIREKKHSLSLVSKRECSFLLYVYILEELYYVNGRLNTLVWVTQVLCGLETIFADIIAMNVSGFSSARNK